MSDSLATHRPRRRRPVGAIMAVALTASACLLALLFRDPLRGRYWAWRLAGAETLAQRSAYLTLLSNLAGDSRWGAAALLDHSDPELRQYGTLVLHQVRTEWSRERLLKCLKDPDIAVQRLAAIGLAIHGDSGVIPVLLTLFARDDETAGVVCLALQHLATPQAVEALDELAGRPASPAQRSALVDALAGVNRAECVPALIEMLDDHRSYVRPAYVESAERGALAALQRSGEGPAAVSQPAAGGPVTIAERAAAGLCRITGFDMSFSSFDAADVRAKAIRQWTDWYTSRSGAGRGRGRRDSLESAPVAE